MRNYYYKTGWVLTGPWEDSLTTLRTMSSDILLRFTSNLSYRDKTRIKQIGKLVSIEINKKETEMKVRRRWG
jgi:hypothetical protein